MEKPNQSNNVAAFAVSKDLRIPIHLKLGYLQPGNNAKVLNELAKPSGKYSDPSIFKQYSHIQINSDLYVKIEVIGGNNQNPLTIPTQSMYYSFSNNKRVWNKVMKLPINYNQVSMDSYLKITIFEVVETKPTVFGVGFISLFNHDDYSLRKGLQKIPIRTTNILDEEVNYSGNSDLSSLESKVIKYENGEFPKIQWLDKLSMPLVEKNRTEEQVSDENYSHYLYIEFPKFELPIIYSDISYSLPDTKAIVNEFIKHKKEDFNNTGFIINKVNITGTKVFDPDYHYTNLSLLNNPQMANGANQTGYMPVNKNMDPIEFKYHKLERNMNNSILLDKELKPTPQLRDELMKILNKPSNIELTDNEKNLIWKFRYYFSKNNSTSTNTDNKDFPKTEVSKTNQKFLTKFLKSINWDNDYEIDHAFKEILPYYWSVDKIQIGDALELLSSYFNPFTLVRRINVQEEDKTNKDKESRIDKIFKYVRQLRLFAVDRLRLASGDELLLYLLQLVQAMKYESIIVDTETNQMNKDITGIEDDDDEEAQNNKTKDNKILEKSPLASFLIEKSIENEKLGNFFYWYVKVENEDQLNSNDGSPVQIYSIVLNKYIENLKRYSNTNRLPNYSYLKRQVWFIKKLTQLVELLRSTFKKNEATAKKVQFLKEYLADSSNELLKFPHTFPLPLDPSVMICGCYPEESAVFKSSLAPLKITLKTVIKDPNQPSHIFGKSKKYGKYTLMFKIGDDLRQDQLVIQIIDLMDQLLKNENLDLRLTPYRILATSPIAGMIQFVPNETLDSVLVKNYDIEETSHLSNGILKYLKYHSKELQPIEPIATSVLKSPDEELLPKQVTQKHAVTSDLGVSSMVLDNYVRSCAGYCVITYLLGVGDRHLDNLLLSPNGKFWHADFGYILGRDPKPFPPLMKLPIQVIDGMGGLDHENFNIFKNYCFVTYTTLRKNSNLILNLFQLMMDANIPDIKADPGRAVEKVQEKFCLDMSEEEAIIHFQNLINDSVNAFLPVVIDRLHSLAQYWRA
ncbi:phosphatidylinositol 3-kinase Vps34p [[Candida] jaroonii]|uniref:Phosphatidylinositol 3-kinase Vps34p n=1 Tax=[Candida] jaroonii TaxID=467808 RepID=A0ACA9Y282_9ASCO|nr:phosphatidylinositol 3-kinase Vps34p [[Candida] jaroonii]